MTFPDPRVNKVMPIVSELLSGYDYTIFGSVNYKERVGDLDIAIKCKPNARIIKEVRQCMIDGDKFFSSPEVEKLIPANCEYDIRYFSRHSYFTDKVTYSDGIEVDYIKVNITLNDNIPWLCGFSTILPTPGIPRSAHAVLLQRAITKALDNDWEFRSNGLYKVHVKNNKAFNLELITADIEQVPNCWGINMDHKDINCFGTLLEAIASTNDKLLLEQIIHHYDNCHLRQVYADYPHFQKEIDDVVILLNKVLQTGTYRSPVHF